MPVSKAGADDPEAMSRKPDHGKRKPVGYDREFLDATGRMSPPTCRPKEREHLRSIGSRPDGGQPAGTYAKQILSRLLIDLSWNSSRLEGNTYSLLDTKRLIEFGQQAEGKDQLEAQMILNHKDAIEFLVGAGRARSASTATPSSTCTRMLANNLLADPTRGGPAAPHRASASTGSVFHPLEVPQLIEECFDQILATAAAIKDPFEQAFFVMVQLPYLQPFDDVNKRVSRLAANIPLIKAQPLAAVLRRRAARRPTPRPMLGVYELNRIDLLKDVFIWAYERSAAAMPPSGSRSASPIRSGCATARRCATLVGEVVRGRMDKKAAAAHVARGSRRISTPQSASSSARSPRASCSACTRATSRATRSGRRSSRRGSACGLIRRNSTSV